MYLFSGPEIPAIRGVFFPPGFSGSFLDVIHGIPFGINWFLTDGLFFLPVHTGVPAYLRYRLTCFQENASRLKKELNQLNSLVVIGFHTGYPVDRCIGHNGQPGMRLDYYLMKT